jgi:hypothetical protein
MRTGFNRIIRAERGAPPCGAWLELARVGEQVDIRASIVLGVLCLVRA